MVKNMLRKTASKETKEKEPPEDDSDDNVEFLPTYKRYHAMKFQETEQEYARPRGLLANFRVCFSPENSKEFFSPEPMNLEIDSPTPPINEPSTPTERIVESPEANTSHHEAESAYDEIAAECHGTDEPLPLQLANISLGIFQ